MSISNHQYLRYQDNAFSVEGALPYIKIPLSLMAGQDVQVQAYVATLSFAITGYTMNLSSGERTTVSVVAFPVHDTLITMWACPVG